MASENAQSGLLHAHGQTLVISALETSFFSRLLTGSPEVAGALPFLRPLWPGDVPGARVGAIAVLAAGERLASWTGERGRL